ncbi:TRAP transporter substrate-binding protein DctP [Thermodesulfobacteriota bacterium]
MIVKRLARVLLLLILALFFLSANEAFSASKDKPIVWKHSSRTTEKGSMNRIIVWFYDQIEKRTNGRFKMKYFWNASLVSAREAPNALKAGISQSTLWWPPFYAAKIPLQTLDCLPFMAPRNRTKAAALHVELNKHPAVQAEMARWDAMLLAPNSFGQEEFLGTKPVRNLGDLKGLRVGAHREWTGILKRFGGINVSLPTPGTYDALQKGVMDSTLYSDGTALAYRLFEVAKYNTRVAITGMVAPFVCKKSAFDALPGDIKKVFREVSKEALTHFPKHMDGIEKRALGIYKKKGIEIVTMPKEDLAQIEKAAKEIAWTHWVEQYEKQGLPAKELMDYYLAKKKAMMP